VGMRCGYDLASPPSGQEQGSWSKPLRNANPIKKKHPADGTRTRHGQQRECWSPERGGLGLLGSVLARVKALAKAGGRCAEVACRGSCD
jgi:hypothetical protein